MSDLPDQQVTTGLSGNVSKLPWQCCGWRYRMLVADAGHENESSPPAVRDCETASSSKLISDQLTELAMTIDLG